MIHPMRTRTVLSSAALAALTLCAVSCFWQPAGGAGSGTLSFSLPPRATARWASGASPDTLRVYVMGAGSVLVPFGPTAHPYYDEVTLGSTAGSVSYTTPPVPAGGPYSVLVAAGGSLGGAFAPTDYGQADGVTVTAGGSTAAAVTLQAVPWFRGDLWGQAMTGAVDAGGIWASSSSKLYSVTISGSFPTITSVTAAESTTPVPAGYSINALSFGQGDPWLDTDKGILPFHLGSPVTSFASGAGIQDVLLSSVQSYGTIAPTDVAFYQRAGGIGGTILSAGVPTTWYDVDLSTFLAGTRVLDFVNGDPNGPGYVYFATGHGAFRLAISILGGGATAQQVLDRAIAQFFGVSNGTAELPITCLALLGTTLYIGTTDGVWTVTIDESNATDPFGGNVPARLPGTAGKTIRKAAPLNNGIQQYAAFLTDTGILLWSSVGPTVTDYPFYGGLPCDLPTEIRQMSWYFGSVVALVVAGKNGLVVLPVANNQS
jgi:hypothetical protein